MPIWVLGTARTGATTVDIWYLVVVTEKRLQELFKLWQTRLGLDHWDIEVRVEACRDENCFMENRRSRVYLSSVIAVQPWVLTGRLPERVIDHKLTDERIEAKVVHELLHCVTFRMSNIVQDTLEGQLHRDVQTVVERTFSDAEENAIECLAVALVKAWRAG